MITASTTGVVLEPLSMGVVSSGVDVVLDMERSTVTARADEAAKNRTISN